MGTSILAGETVILAAPAAHGQVTLAPDGSFTYLPAQQFVGTDTFSIAMARGSARSTSVEVVIMVIPRGSSTVPASQPAIVSPSPGGDAFVVGATSGGDMSGPSVSFGSLGPLDFSFDWFIPGFFVTLPGLLVILAVLAQVIAGAGWLPIVRRELGDIGVRRRRRLGRTEG